MDPAHGAHAQEIQAAVALSLEAEEVQGFPLHPEDVLLLSCQECPHRMHLGLAWELYRQGSDHHAEGGALG